MRRRLSPLDVRVAQERDLYAFCWETLGYVDMHAPLHRRVCEFLTTWKDPSRYIKVLIIPRGHLKSSLASIGLPLWTWLHDPGARFLLSHGKRSIAISFLREQKTHLIHNRKLKGMAPDVFHERPHKEADVWNQDQYNILRDDTDFASGAKVPSMMAAGTDSSVVGMHFHYLVFDDLVFKENVGTPEMRRKTLQYIQDSMALLRPGGRVIIIGTRWHWDDCYATLIDPHGPYRDNVDSLVMDCGYEEGEPIFPISASGRAGFTMDTLTDKLKSMGSFSFYAQYMNQPKHSAEGYFSRSDLKVFDLTDDPPYLPLTDRTYTFFTAVDPNRSDKTKDDPCAVVTAAVDDQGHIWVVDISRGHPPATELVLWIRSHVERWRPQKVFVETNNYQLQLCNWLRRDQLMSGVLYPIEEVNRGGTTRKVDRILSMQALVESHALHIKRGYDFMMDEFSFFPTWKTDDCVDALADIVRLGYGNTPRKEEKPTPHSPFLMKNLLDSLGSSGHPVSRIHVPGP